VDESLRLRRIAGVPVGASWSLLVILGLITWTLGAEVLGRRPLVMDDGTLVGIVTASDIERTLEVRGVGAMDMGDRGHAVRR
jgi:CBS domain-containing protein